VIRHKQRKDGSFRALERAGRHGSGYAKRWVQRYQDALSLEKSVKDRPRKGRPSKIAEKHIKFIKRLIKADHTVGSAEIARDLASEFGVRVSAETVRKALLKNGFQYSSPKRVLKHTIEQKKERHRLALEHRKRERVAFSRVMFTDSKSEPFSCDMFYTTMAPHWPTSSCLSSQAVQKGACVHGSYCLWSN
jgi:transposase